ncbi:MAG: M2 family metallopeptidase [Deltaproteobacteria bacterium]|nr:M2 family metallopeptidase [Deltaproteobacteria bacterium]
MLSRLLLPIPLILLSATCCPPKGAAKPNDAALAAEATKFVADADKELRRVLVGAAEAQWANATDITDAHEAAESAANSVQNDTVAKLIKQARKYEPILDQLDPSTRRQLQALIYMTTVAIPVAPSPDDPQRAAELAKTGTEMASIYGKGKVCDASGANCQDLAALSKTMQTTRDPNAALAAWKGWHDTVGRQERDLFIKYVGLANDGAKAIGFTDVAAMWKSAYDMPADQFEAETDRLFNQLKPLYTQLHCYARGKLNGIYGDAVVAKTGPMPAHLLGNMWAQSWDWMYKELEPYPGEAVIDVTPAIAAKLDDKGMVRLGEAFYTSLGMPPLPQTFWERSMFQKPAGKEAVCHASAWDVGFNNDLRLKMCIEKTQEDLVTVHHELGHHYYFAAYYKLPIVLQQGANDGFHEAIGDTVALSMTPQYLKTKGLLDEVKANDKVTINRQMHNALEKIAFLPFGLVVDKWRWDVFSGKVAPADYNKHWWDLRRKYQGIMPGVARGPEDFDPGAKYHVPANVPYMRYFLARVLQFQFHRALCKEAGHKGPLNECSVYDNKAVGESFWKMLQLGASVPWQDALFQLTGEKQMDATAILEYFAPLQTWLEQQNKGQSCGW